MVAERTYLSLLVASTLSGVTLCRLSHGEVSEVGNWILGLDEPELEITDPLIKLEMHKRGYSLFPALPKPVPAYANYRQAITDTLLEYGHTITIPRQPLYSV